MATVMRGARLFGHRTLVPANARYARVVARERAGAEFGARDIVGAVAFAAAAFGILVTLGAPLWIAVFAAVAIGFVMSCTPRYTSLADGEPPSL
jgi:hypothetical protein